MTDEAIPAATLIVVRDRPKAAPELLMVERAEGMAFAAGALVFPGGRIDQADRDFANELGVAAEALAAIRTMPSGKGAKVRVDRKAFLLQEKAPLLRCRAFNR